MFRLHRLPNHRSPAVRWLLVVLVLLLAIGNAGCHAWQKLRARAAEDRRQFMEALRPLADPNGSVLSSEARQIERKMSRDRASLP
jgi:hypothetical protein